MEHQEDRVTTVGGGAVFVVPLDEAACQVAVSEIHGAGEDPVLRPETKAAIENAEADSEDSQMHRVRCTGEGARDLIQFFDRVAATLQLGGNYDRSTACAQSAERLRRLLDGPVLT
jgi:hypothetical protein